MNLLTDEKELAEIEALCEAATPEPWVIGIQIAARSWPVFSLRDMETATEDEARRDAALIERCRTDLPRAVATIRALKAQVEKLDEEIRQLGVDKQHLEQWAWQTFGPRFDPWGRQKLIQVAQEFERSLCAAEEIAGLKARVAELEQLLEEATDEASATQSNWDLPENFDEWSQGYGRCETCGMPYSIVRPGKGQPACECEEEAPDAG